MLTLQSLERFRCRTSLCVSALPMLLVLLCPRTDPGGIQRLLFTLQSLDRLRCHTSLSVKALLMLLLLLGPRNSPGSIDRLLLSLRLFNGGPSLGFRHINVDNLTVSLE